MIFLDMNPSTIEQGEELLSGVTPGKWQPDGYGITSGEYKAFTTCRSHTDAKFIAWMKNHASELLQMAREVEERRKAMMFCSGPCNPSFTRAQIDVENNEAPVLSLDDYKRWT